MATYSNNTTLKVSAAVSAASNSAAASGTIYTCPANSYAELNLCMLWVAGVHNVTVAGQRVNAINSASYTIPIIVGPGQAVAYTNTISSGNVAYVSGVEFINTP